MIERTILGLAIALASVWIALAAFLLIARPKGVSFGEIARLLPDTLRLLSRLGRDRNLPIAVRARVWGLLLYLASPIDLIPDFIPVIGHVDDAIIAVLVLRSVARRTGIAELRRHWPGSDDGFASLCRLAGL